MVKNETAFLEKMASLNDGSALRSDRPGVGDRNVFPDRFFDGIRVLCDIGDHLQAPSQPSWRLFTPVNSSFTPRLRAELSRVKTESPTCPQRLPPRTRRVVNYARFNQMPAGFTRMTGSSGGEKFAAFSLSKQLYSFSQRLLPLNCH